MGHFAKLDYLYFIATAATFLTAILMWWFINSLREKANGKVLFVLKDNRFWWAAAYFLVFMMFMRAITNNIGSFSLNKILENWIYICTILMCTLNSFTKTVLTTKGIEIRLIKWRTRVVTEWPNIIEWSILSDKKLPSSITLKYKHRYKGKIKEVEMQFLTEEKERIIEIFQENVSQNLNNNTER